MKYVRPLCPAGLEPAPHPVVGTQRVTLDCGSSPQRHVNVGEQPAETWIRQWINLIRMYIVKSKINL